MESDMLGSLGVTIVATTLMLSSLLVFHSTLQNPIMRRIRMIFPLGKLIMGRMQLSQNLDQPILVVEAKKAKSPNPFPISPSTSI